MKRSLFELCLFCCVGLTLLGCGLGGPGGVTKGSVNGITYEIHGGHGQSTDTSNDAIKIASGKNVIEIKDGRISLNGKDRGPIKSGDVLVFDAESQLSVNGEKR